MPGIDSPSSRCTRARTSTITPPPVPIGQHRPRRIQRPGQEKQIRIRHASRITVVAVIGVVATVEVVVHSRTGEQVEAPDLPGESLHGRAHRCRECSRAPRADGDPVVEQLARQRHAGEDRATEHTDLRAHRGERGPRFCGREGQGGTRGQWPAHLGALTSGRRWLWKRARSAPGAGPSRWGPSASLQA